MKLMSFYFKMRKVLCGFQKCNKNLRKGVFEIMTFEHIARISLKYDKNTCDWQSTCYQTAVRFQIWLREILPNSICLGLMES